MGYRTTFVEVQGYPKCQNFLPDPYVIIDPYVILCVIIDPYVILCTGDNIKLTPSRAIHILLRYGNGIFAPVEAVTYHNLYYSRAFRKG
jgi:hypothetical protein